MHIIKITPHSFKIILSKEDLKRYGVENVLDNKELSGDFFAEIIAETNSRYGNPFMHGAIDAEFFESKDGGGELFISRSSAGKETTYLFQTQDSDALYALCKRLSSFHLPKSSTLFVKEKEYILIISYPNVNSLVFSCIKEYGKVFEANRLQRWMLYEHAKTLICENAVEKLSEIF